MRRLYEMNELVPALLKLIESINKDSQNPVVCDEVLLNWSQFNYTQKKAELEKASKAVDRILSLWGDDKRYSNDNTIVHIAAIIGDAALMRAVLALKKINMNHPNSNGDTPFHLAIKYGHTEVQYILIRCLKFDMNKENADGLTPLGMALLYDCSTLAYFLFQYNDVNKNWKNKHGNTILHIAAAYGRIAAVDELLRRGGKDINAVNNNGHTPLDLAVWYGRTQVAKALVRCPHIDPEKVSQDRFSSLGVEAVSDRHPPKARLLSAATGACMGLAFVATAAHLYFHYRPWATAPSPISEPGCMTESSQAPSPMNP